MTEKIVDFFNQSPEFQLFVGMLYSLAYVPPEDIVKVILRIKIDIFNYSHTWSNHLFYPQVYENVILEFVVAWLVRGG